MQTFKATCTDGFTKSVTANSKDEAVQLLMADPEVQNHVIAGHPELAGKTPEELTSVLSGMVQPVAEEPSEGGTPPVGNTAPPTGGSTPPPSQPQGTV